jgi:PAS domain S-box-containing protein
MDHFPGAVLRGQNVITRTKMSAKRRILIVEDETIVAMDIERGLRALGYEVAGVTGSGEEAVRLAGVHRPDVALMDIRLHGRMDGIEAGRIIRTQYQVPIVFLTAHADAGTVERAKVAEPFGYLLKPFEDGELHTTLEIAFHKRELEKAAAQEAFEALHLSEQRFRMLVDSLKDHAIFLLDLRGRIVSWNPGAERVYGYEESQVLGKHVSIFYRPEDIVANEPERYLRRAVLEGRAHTEGWRVRKDGGLFWAEVVVTPLLDRSGQLVGFARMTRDITERKRAEEQIRELNSSLERRVQERTAELNEANKELEAFAYSVAHDLRAPLRGLRSYLSIIQEEIGPGVPPETAAYLDRSTDCAERMTRLIDDLLSLSQIGRHGLKRKSLALDKLVREVIEELKPETTGRQIEWRLQPLPLLHCDTGLIRQVFANLLSNAVKYTLPRSQAIIEVGRTEEAGETLLFVRDNGVGFDMSRAHKLFQPFTRLHPNREFQGSGVGLATVDRIIRRHGGRIWAEAAPDQGATFFFSLGPNCLARSGQADLTTQSSGPPI